MKIPLPQNIRLEMNNLIWNALAQARKVENDVKIEFSSSKIVFNTYILCGETFLNELSIIKLIVFLLGFYRMRFMVPCTGRRFFDIRLMVGQSHPRKRSANVTRHRTEYRRFGKVFQTQT
jgi:hypothetical protein